MDIGALAPAKIRFASDKSAWSTDPACGRKEDELRRASESGQDFWLDTFEEKAVGATSNNFLR
jgi:hypothetical protein